MNDASNPHGDSAPIRLTAAEAETVVAQLAHVQGAGLPLAAALRTAGAESQRWRVRRALLVLAARLEQGQPLDEALAQGLPQLPSHLAELVRISTHSARGGALLTAYVNDQRRERILRREIRAALVYPSAVFCAAIVVSVLVPSMFMRSLLEIYEDFQIKLPHSLRVSAWIGEWGPIFLASTILASMLVAAVAWIGLGTARCRSAMMGIPFIGPVWRWLEIASWARAMQLLIEGEVPLADALRCTSDGLRDWKLSEAVRQVALRVDHGMPLARAMTASGEGVWHETLIAFIRHGEQNRLLSNSLESVARICDERARQRGRWFRLAFPSVVFVMVAHCLLFSYANVLRPLFELISKLT